MPSFCHGQSRTGDHAGCSQSSRRKSGRHRPFRFSNQVNNVVAFPGIFKGALEGRAVQITEEMKLAAARAIAGLVPDDKLNEENIMPEAFDPRVAEAVAEAVKSHIRQ